MKKNKLQKIYWINGTVIIVLLALSILLRIKSFPLEKTALIFLTLILIGFQFFLGKKIKTNNK